MYKVSHKATSQEYALKVVSKSLVSSIEDVQRLATEFEIGSSHQHPNLARYLHKFEDIDNFYLLIEFVAGSNLFEYMKSRGTSLAEEEAAPILF